MTVVRLPGTPDPLGVCTRCGGEATSTLGTSLYCAACHHAILLDIEARRLAEGRDALLEPDEPPHPAETHTEGNEA